MLKKHRSFQIKELRVKREKGKPPVIEGYAALYNSQSQVLSEEVDGEMVAFREVIAPGAFTKTLATKPDVRALINHDSNLVLGRTASGTLSLTEDEKGLRVSIVPPDTQYARDLMVCMERKDVDQMSFGFYVPEGGDEWSDGDEGVKLRTLKEIDLKNGDVSAVTFPAYADTSVGVRQLQLRAARQRLSRSYVYSAEPESALRDAAYKANDAAESFRTATYDHRDKDGFSQAHRACRDVEVASSIIYQLADDEESSLHKEGIQMGSRCIRSAAATVAKADHPTARMAAAIFEQCAEQCDDMHPMDDDEEEEETDEEEQRTAAKNAEELDRLRLAAAR